MKLTRKDNPETIKRYSHVKRARGWKTKTCSMNCPGTAHGCTLKVGHGGPHVAHGFLGGVLAVWDPGTGDQRVPPRRRPRGVGAPTPQSRRGWTHGILGALWKRLRGILSSGEELAMLVLLAAFIGFAVSWLLIILR